VNDELIGIGDFGRATGLSEKALRLYDARGLLVPADIDPTTGYRRYAARQVPDGRYVAALRAVDMPLTEIAEVMALPHAERTDAVARYWYRIEMELEQARMAVRELRGVSEREERGVTVTEEALERGRTEGAFAAIASLARVRLDDAAEAYNEAMRTAYWEDKDLTLSVAIAYAGVSRLLTAAGAGEDEERSRELRSLAKALTYNVASFAWVGWGEPGIDVSPTEAAAGLAAARTNLAMADDLDRGDLARSRAHWMLGAHFLTAGEPGEARTAFEQAATFADRAAAPTEVRLAAAFAALADLAAGADGADVALQTALEALSAADEGEAFVSQVTTCREILGV
jgi:DNA-binding transcriptional MerR regulator